MFQAVDPESGRSVALKTVIPVRGASHRLRREIETLARLEHPGIVRVIEHGEEAGQPWLAMELVAGETLRTRMASTPAETLPPEASSVPPVSAGARHLLGLFPGLCSALRYLHGEGIVHGDLKPDNVMVLPDGGVVVVDFGLASQWGAAVSREELAGLDVHPGTFWYSSPEQARGDPLDARADLYALGCILYEVIAGSPPFVGSDPMQVLSRHADERPAPLASRASGIDPRLDRLVLRLLEKDPRKRPGYAEDVSRMLVQAGVSTSRSVEGPKGRTYLYRPGFVGRSQAKARIAERLSGLARGSGSVVLLSGRSGIGKTRLLVELGRQARGHRVAMLSATCPPDRTVALGGLRSCLAQIVDRTRDGSDLDLGSRARLLAPYVPAMMDRSPPPESRPGAVVGTLVDLFVALARAAPLILVLDDLHWADDLTLDFLNALTAPGLEELPLMVVGARRSEEDLPEGLASLIGRPGVHQIELPRLQASAVERLVGEMLGLAQPPSALCQLLYQRSEGNPFFLGEYLRACVEMDLLRRDSDGAWKLVSAPGSVPLPKTLRELIGQRLDGLGPGARLLVDAAAVLDAEPSPNELHAVAAALAPVGDADWAQLFDRELLEELPDGKVRLSHGSVRETAGEFLDPERRRSLHRSAVVWLQDRPEPERERRMGSLGRHLEAVGESTEAQAAYRAAAESARRHHALAEAERWLVAYLELPGGTAVDRAAARIERGRILVSLGRVEEGAWSHQAALTEAEAPGDEPLRMEALLGLAHAESERDRLGPAERLFEAALTLAQKRDDAAGAGTALQGLARVDRARGRAASARRRYEQALIHCQRLGRSVEEGHVLGGLANLALEEGDLEGAQRYLEQALERLEGHDARRHPLTTLASLHLRRRDATAARRLFRQALKLHRRVGDRMGELIATSNLAALETEQGRSDKADGLLRKSLRMAQEVGQPSTELRARINLGNLRLRQGRIDEARLELERAAGLAQRLDQPREEAQAQGNLAVVLRETGDLEGAAARYAVAIDLARRAGDAYVEGIMRANLAGVHHARGRGKEARRATFQALRIHRRLGDRHSEGLALMNLVELDLEDGRVDLARRRLAQARALGRDRADPNLEGLALVQLGVIEVEAGRPRRARRCFDAAVAVRPSDPAVRARLGELRGLLEGAGGSAGGGS